MPTYSLHAWSARPLLSDPTARSTVMLLPDHQKLPPDQSEWVHNKIKETLKNDTVITIYMKNGSTVEVFPSHKQIFLSFSKPDFFNDEKVSFLL